MSSHEDVKKKVKDWLIWTGGRFYDAGIQELVTRNKCLNLQRVYVEE
jgi:hypothetical protein